MALKFTQCRTLSDFKTYVDNVEISYPKTFLKGVVQSGDTNLIVNYTSLLNNYMDYIKDITTQVTMSETELIKYKYNPKLLCYDLYGTVELWGLLLKVNNMTSVLDFKTNKINVFSHQIFSLLNEIFILEKNNITNNNIMVKETE